MKHYLILVLIVLSSCKNSIHNFELSKLNGHWEIEKVDLPNGDSKEYTINETIDYFEIGDSLKGFRKKLVPQFDGKFLTNEVEENIYVKKIHDKFYLVYKTDFADWKEEIISLNDNELVLKNEQNISYYYKRKVFNDEE